MLLSEIFKIKDGRIITKDADFKEEEHPRGQSGETAGQFVKKGEGGAAGKSKSEEDREGGWRSSWPNSLTENDQKSIRKWGKENRRNANLNSIQKKAFIEYRRSTGFEINEFLRGKSVPDVDKKEFNRIVGHMDGVINRSIIDKDIIVYRGIPKHIDTKVGEIFSDKSFISTTFDPEQAVNFSMGPGKRSTIFKLDVPKGSHGLYMEGLAPHGWEMAEGKEQEILLPRNTQISITDVVKKGNSYYISGKVKKEPEG